jgi:hypothetical protein
MGLAFTVDTPIKVARYGINSVISIIEDKLIELMRKHYYQQSNRPFVPITPDEHDYRARRITDYLNLVNDIVRIQVEKLRTTVFETGSDVTKYFEMLPGNNRLRLDYERMVHSRNELEKQSLASLLKNHIQPGRIDVNIMTKVDKNNHDNRGNVIPDSSDALAALRGYVKSDLTNSSVVFSAGLNPRLYNYLESFQEFHAKGVGKFDKEIVIKVSDYRSALIQGKYLAKKAIWVSEFRIESGLNCGGHAFATDGTLLGPILEEFKTKRSVLIQALHDLYQPAARSKGIATFEEPHPIRITAQGGIGTSEESSFLSTYYNLDGTGWGTPFLLCPEATTVDTETLGLLGMAGEKDVVLSKASPLGVRFNYLKGTSAEYERLARIKKGKPGSPCTEKHLVSNTEFTSEPICIASHSYQRRKIEQLKSLKLTADEYQKRFDDVVSKECLCIGLSNSAIRKYDLPPVKRLEAVTICPGPNIAYFSNVVTLREMTDHIYGRANLISGENRPHMFIKELTLNIKFLEEKVTEVSEMNRKIVKDLQEFSANLLKGIQYYRSFSSVISCDHSNFDEQLNSCEGEVNNMILKLEKLLIQADEAPLNGGMLNSYQQ